MLCWAKTTIGSCATTLVANNGTMGVEFHIRIHRPALPLLLLQSNQPLSSPCLVVIAVVVAAAAAFHLSHSASQSGGNKIYMGNGWHSTEGRRNSSQGERSWVDRGVRGGKEYLRIRYHLFDTTRTNTLERVVTLKGYHFCEIIS